MKVFGQKRNNIAQVLENHFLVALLAIKVVSSIHFVVMLCVTLDKSHPPRHAAGFGLRTPPCASTAGEISARRKNIHPDAMKAPLGVVRGRKAGEKKCGLLNVRAQERAFNPAIRNKLIYIMIGVETIGIRRSFG